MSNEGTPTPFMERHSLALKRELYVQYGHPWWDIDSWLQPRLVQFTVKGWGRYGSRHRLARFRRQLSKDAAAHRAALMAPGYRGPETLIWERLLTVLGDAIPLSWNDEDIPEGWDMSQKEKHIMAALQYVDTELSKRRRQVFHLRSVLGLPEEHCGTVLGVAKSTISSTLTQAWTAMEENSVDIEAIEWFLKRETSGASRPKSKDQDGTERATI